MPIAYVLLGRVRPGDITAYGARSENRLLEKSSPSSAAWDPIASVLIRTHLIIRDVEPVIMADVDIEITNPDFVGAVQFLSGYL